MERYASTIQNQPLAFSSDPNLVSSSYRLFLKTKDGAELNIECFDPPDSSPSTPILLFIHGICESAETKGIQTIAKIARSRSIRLAVLELEGHGLSSGKRCVCPNFDRLLSHTLEFASFTVSSFAGTETENTSPFYYLSGTSLGGVLAIYAAEIISNQNVSLDTSFPSNFQGVAPICPAVGVDARAIPSSIVTSCLSLLACVAPSAQIPLTPLEDPNHYNCPKTTTRNFSGHWPLSTSKMLLDVTTFRVTSDIEHGELSLSNVKHVIVFLAENDTVVPMQSITNLFESLTSINKKLIRIPHAGHDIMFQNSSSQHVSNILFEWISSNTE
jgi:alpha-beta hydrolase superfamily lysophospholipase